MQRVAAVAPDVLQLRRRDDERQQSLFVEDRADRVHSRAAVGTDRRQEAEPHAELVEEITAGRRQLGSLFLQITPRRHGAPWRSAQFPSSPRGGAERNSAMTARQRG